MRARGLAGMRRSVTASSSLAGIDVLEGPWQMRNLGFSRSAPSICVAAAFLAGCGGSQPPIGTADMRQPTIQRATSSGSALLYVVMGGSGVHILTYPGLKQVKRFPGWGLSASNVLNGDVLIGGFEGPVNLYAHGSTKLLHAYGLKPGGELPYDGAFDPTSNAVAITVNSGIGRGHVFVYQTPKSKPTRRYTLPNIQYAQYLGYDIHGNLFVDGQGSQTNFALAELPKGGNAFVALTVDGTITNSGAIQWDGNYITVVYGSSIYRLQISISTAFIVGQTKLIDVSGGLGEFWIQGNTVIAPHISDRPHNGRWVGFWHYPAGGRAYQILRNLSKNKHDRMFSATVSAAPSR
jgi:hypothetical protein